MRIAILGATSMLAVDFVATVLPRQSECEFTLFARSPEAARAALLRRGAVSLPECCAMDEFGTQIDLPWDAIINFVGVGDPARAMAMGADILAITRHWDDRVLSYIRNHPTCRYIFLSSGAAFGEAFLEPVERASNAVFAINDLPPSAYYGISKFYAEAVHRASLDLDIIDLRIFNYVSEYANLDHRFLVTEMIRAVRDDTVLFTDASDMWRDYLGREDLTRLLLACLDARRGFNGGVDAYSCSPTSKSELLMMFHTIFGLKYAVRGGGEIGINATGRKSLYYSTNTIAATLGYEPQFTSCDVVVNVARTILS